MDYYNYFKRFILNVIVYALKQNVWNFKVFDEAFISSFRFPFDMNKMSFSIFWKSDFLISTPNRQSLTEILTTFCSMSSPHQQKPTTNMKIVNAVYFENKTKKTKNANHFFVESRFKFSAFSFSRCHAMTCGFWRFGSDFLSFWSR
jgi:hypothetical protein